MIRCIIISSLSLVVCLVVQVEGGIKAVEAREFVTVDKPIDRCVRI